MPLQPIVVITLKYLRALLEGQAPQDVRLIGPGAGIRADVEVRSTDKGMKVVVNQTEYPGIYELWMEVSEKRESARRFSVNVIREKEQPSFASDEMLKAATVMPSSTESLSAEQKTVDFDQPVRGTPLWPFVLLALVVLLATETYAALKV